jgi:hypothetical protein
VHQWLYGTVVRYFEIDEFLHDQAQGHQVGFFVESRQLGQELPAVEG